MFSFNETSLLLFLMVGHTIESPSFHAQILLRTNNCIPMKLTGLIGPFMNFKGPQKFLKKVPTVRSYPKNATKKLMHSKQNGF